ncbi:signal transducing adapter molecule 2 [Chelonus insularis]|uniref:signal transducing adapter molecule 2 n=1 Tax=Chelonus insularis TaxID=460826 RepID=UPI00158B221D|nr:signal transducing adapter molecule 2 [Chelonus insularis]
MGLFSMSSPFDTDVEKATSEKNTSEDWALILEICDAVGNSPQKAKECLKAIVKRLNAQDPHIVIQAITLLDACSSNCGKNFHLEIASREFEGELKKLLTRNQQKIVDKTKSLLKKWAEEDFKNDPQLHLIPSLYNKLKSEGYDFSHLSEPKHSCGTSLSTSKEEQDLAKAIELSLKENKQHSSSSTHGSPASVKMTSLYPNMSTSLSNSSTSERRKVRALYDFEAAEDNELSFTAGDIIRILDDSDANWWKGAKGKIEGLFPANFVTADLSAEPDHITKLEQGTKKAVQFAEEVDVKMLKKEPEVIEVEIEESKIDRLLHLLHEADPQSEINDSPEMLDLEEQVTAMGPLIDTALEKVDRRHAQLTQLSSDLVDALNLYHTLMREPVTTTYNSLPKMQSNMNMYPPYVNHVPHMFNGMVTHPNYNQVTGPPPGAFQSTVTGLPTNEYINAHNISGMAISQQYHMPSGSHQPPPGTQPIGQPTGPNSVIHSQVPPLHMGVSRSLQSQGSTLPHHQTLPTSQTTSGHQGQPHTAGATQVQAVEQPVLPYHTQGFSSQGMQIPPQYVTPTIQGSVGPIPVTQPTQYTPLSGQRMM